MTGSTVRIALALLELIGFVVFLIALLTFWWKIPLTAPFWPTVGYTFAFIGIALAWCALILFTLLARPRRRHR